jgi:hypothetical protein
MNIRVRIWSGDHAAGAGFETLACQHRAGVYRYESARCRSDWKLFLVILRQGDGE